MPYLFSKPVVWGLFWAVLYLGVMLGSVALWRFFRRRRRIFPFKERVRLLRQPGETLLKHVNARDERLLGLVLFGYFVPILIGLGLILFVPVVQKWTGWQMSSHGIIVTGGAGFLGVAISLVLIIRNLSVRSNFYLGYCGERFIAEQLKPLELAGWRVFHDVPASDGKIRFNLDHVVIGPGGVSVIETKAPRKHARLKNGHVVEFDGSMLTWPGGARNRWGMNQTLRNAYWLREFLKTSVGQTVDVMPILTFPTWYVEERKKNPEIRVIGPTYLAETITARGREVLTPDQIQLYGRQVERLCRDVEL